MYSQNRFFNFLFSLLSVTFFFPACIFSIFSNMVMMSLKPNKASARHVNLVLFARFVQCNIWNSSWEIGCSRRGWQCLRWWQLIRFFFCRGYGWGLPPCSYYVCAEGTLRTFTCCSFYPLLKSYSKNTLFKLWVLIYNVL